MRIVMDLQALQSTGSRNRGIGRYSLSLAHAIARNRGEHEVLIALNDIFPDTIEQIRNSFDGLLPKENIRVWSAVAPVAGIDNANDWRRQSAELVREAFLASLRPDVVHVSSLIEGFMDDAVTSVGAISSNIPTAVTLYDLIPYIHRKPYLDNPAIKEWYLGKIEHLRRADLWLAISESSRREGIEYLGLSDEWVVNISTDADPHFRSLQISPEAEHALRQKYRLHRPFVMYTGGIDHRKNIEGLIRAFSNLPTAVRKAHQLAIVCSVHPDSRQALEKLAAQQGLSKDELVLTGFVPEDDLLALYNLCSLFVFPSWHEGFGLPALEAMRCGAPVIGANTSSLPEVIGWDEALFDPHSDDAIAAAIIRALTDDTYRAELLRHGKAQSEKFSWDESARCAISAMERLYAESQVRHQSNVTHERKPRLAYISPLPPEKSGIADYSAELLPELARFYEIDVIVSQEVISHPWIKVNCQVHTVQWFAENAARFERVLYHFGNSTFHAHMFDLLKAVPGVVVLHDFYLSGIVAHREASTPGCWTWELFRSHGYTAVRDRFHVTDTAEVVWKYPCSLSVIQDSLGVIVHSPNSLQLAEHWYGGDSTDWAIIPLLRNSPTCVDKNLARKALGFGAGDFLVCSFGILGPHKLNKRLLQAWLKSPLAQDRNCYLIFVGENQPGDYGQDIRATLRHHRVEQNVRITGWTDSDLFHRYLAAADIGVQLRTLSRGETSAAVLDCMNYGLATVVNANGSMADLGDESVWKLPDEFTDEQLIDALVTLWEDKTRRCRLGQTARDIILRNHNPRSCAEQYSDVIERFYRSAESGMQAIPTAVAGIEGNAVGKADLLRLAESIARSFPPRNKERQLLVDVSTLVQVDSKTGIQRVVRSVLQQWLTNPPAGLRIEPVYATVAEPGYRYARRFTMGFLDCPEDLLVDEVIEYSVGDIFLGLDLQPLVVTAQESFYQKMRRQGVCVKFMVYDLLPVLMPQSFDNGVAEQHRNWLNVVAQSDGAICISRAVADELKSWLQINAEQKCIKFHVDWFHLGANFKDSNPPSAMFAEEHDILDILRSRPSFLVVGTIEPRKGHAQMLGAFDLLWQAGKDVNLVIVGKQGWMVEELVKRIHTHPERKKHLFWLEGISDEYLEKVYAASTCLIAASYGEGFGLPLIEAAQHKLPIIARDIPVFREVAGEHAYYFEAKTPDALSQSIREWLILYGKDKYPKSNNMQWLTWKQSAQQMTKLILSA